MKIAIGGKFYPMNPEMGYGAERMAVNLAIGLIKEGHDVYVFSQKGAWIPGCKIIKISGYPSNSKDIIADAIINSNIKFDIAILQDDIGFWNTPRLPFKYLFIPYGYKFPNDKNCASVVCLSQSQKNRIDDGKSVIIPPSVDGERFIPAREKFDYYTWVGKIWHSRIKPVHHAIEAVKIAGKKIIVISGLIEDKQYFNTMVLPHIDNVNVIFKTDVSEDEKSAILGLSSGLLSPQGYVETFGMNHIEAFACGIPVIYNDPIDRFNEHAPIFYYGNDDVALRIDGSIDLSNKFADKISNIKSDMFVQSRKHFEENFSIPVVTKKWIDLMEKHI